MIARAGGAAPAPSGSSVGPSTPQFQLKLSARPSRLSSPLASLCLLVVAHEVVEREAVVAGDEVDAVDGQAAVGAVEVAAARDPGRDLAEQAAVAAHEAAHRVAVAAVPLGPAKAGEVADLVEAGGVPGLGDDAACGPAISENSMFHSTGAWYIGSPSSPRASTLARSKRKPSTCISRTQYSRHSTM